MAASSTTASSALEQDRLEDVELAVQTADACELLGERAAADKAAAAALIAEVPVVDLTDAQLDEAQLLVERELDTAAAAAAAAAAVSFDQAVLGGSAGTVDVLVKRLGIRQKLGFIWSSDNTITAASEESCLREGDVQRGLRRLEGRSVCGLDAVHGEQRSQVHDSAVDAPTMRRRWFHDRPAMRTGDSRFNLLRR